MKLVIIIVCFFLSFYWFKKASGTLKPNLLNIISYAFYSLMIFEGIGLILVFLGFRNHYLIQKISNSNIFFITFYAFMYAMIALPLCTYAFNKYVYKIYDIKKEFKKNIQKKVVLENSKSRNKMYIYMLIGLIICILATIYVFANIGYVPLFKFFNRGFDYSMARISISRNFAGNEYIKNIFMLLLTPLISYICYIYARLTNEKKWWLLFIISFILCIFIKTYDFEKSPIIYYLCYFFIIEIMLGKTFNIKRIIPFIILVVLLVIISYIVIGKYRGAYLSLSSGPLSRTFVTQAGTLLLHFDAFPNKINFLLGRSFPRIFSFFFGSGQFGIRSGRVIMELYNKNAVMNGTAGVMSTMFLGEAYANFGIIGVIISPIIVGMVFSSVLCVYLKSEKTPLNIILYLECFIILTTVLQAGFVDFIYNISLFVTFVFIYFIKYFLKKEKVN